MRKKFKDLLNMGVVSLLVCTLVLFGLPSNVSADQPYQVVASGLDNPRGLAFGPEGALYVVEAGRGGGGPCIPGPFGTACYGETGAVTRIQNGVQEQIVSNLSSFASPQGRQAFGPHDISFNGRGGAYLVVGGCFLPNESCGRLLHLPASGKWKAIADLTAYEVANNPDGAHPGESDPYAVLALPDERIVADAAANDLLRVKANGDISVIAVFPSRTVNGMEMDAVPTSVAVGPDRAYYVSELTGAPFPVGGARVYRVVPGETPTVYADGFTNIIDLAFESDGSLLVLEMAKNSLASGNPTGALLRLHPDGSRETLLDVGLNYPSAVAIGPNGGIYISNYGQDPGLGEVIRLSFN